MIMKVAEDANKAGKHKQKALENRMHLEKFHEEKLEKSFAEYQVRLNSYKS